MTDDDRPLRPELMDGELSPGEAWGALDDLDRVNRRLFGMALAGRVLLPRLRDRGAGAPVTFLDLGAGSGRLSEFLAAAAARAGVSVRAVCLDRRLAHILAGRSSGACARGVVASAEALPFRDGAFDWTFSNLFFHHFGAAGNRAILAEMRRTARRGAVVVDLRRGRCSRLVGKLALAVMRVGYVTRYDGHVSLAQAWTVPEVRALTRDLPVAELRRRFPFRWSLVVES